MHEAVKSGGLAGEIGMRVHELCVGLAVKVKRLTTPDVRMPASPILQAALLPNTDTIAESVRALLHN